MRRLLIGLLAVPAAAIAYLVFLRRPVLNWGTRPDEAARRLPGDELLEAADVVATRGITIDAPAAAIWPWLIQMGPGRAGAYTYDWIENLFGLNMHSADRIVPEWQSMQVGDAWQNPSGGAMRIERLEPGRVLAMRSTDGTWVWSFVLVGEGASTRFLSRNRFLLTGGYLARLAEMLFIEPGSLVMERKMLVGIKTRAERLDRERREHQAVTTGAEPLAAARDEKIAEPIVS